MFVRVGLIHVFQSEGKAHLSAQLWGTKGAHSWSEHAAGCCAAPREGEGTPAFEKLHPQGRWSQKGPQNHGLSTPLLVDNFHLWWPLVDSETCHPITSKVCRAEDLAAL